MRNELKKKTVQKVLSFFERREKLKEELIEKVKEKIYKEYDEYISELSKKDKKEIIKSSYQTAIIEEIIDAFWGDEAYNVMGLDSLLNKDNTLKSLIDNWMSSDDGIHRIVEENIEIYSEDIAKENPNYKLINNMENVLNALNNYDFCYNLKRKLEIADFCDETLFEVLQKGSNREYLYNFFNEIKDDNHLHYLVEINVMDSEVINTIKNEIIPSLKDGIEKGQVSQKNINKSDREAR